MRWGRRDSNPHGLPHVILSHARLPIPTLPHAEPHYNAECAFAQGQLLTIQCLIDGQVLLDALDIETRFAQGDEFEEQVRVIAGAL